MEVRRPGDLGDAARSRDQPERVPDELGIAALERCADIGRLRSSLSGTVTVSKASNSDYS